MTCFMEAYLQGSCVAVSGESHKAGIAVIVWIDGLDRLGGALECPVSEPSGCDLSVREWVGVVCLRPVC